ncbi:hypothetical protein CBS101457_006847 [Exobasidium rhododendri]|nr:hypothetical protein CBS101457_006847 [Exobasidium rhododendri]
MTTPHKQTAAAATTTSSSSSFFIKERDRLIAEIADGVEQMLGNTNTINRKLEESIAVGQEFEPISSLWGRFVDMLSSSGISPQAAMDATQSQGVGDEMTQQPSRAEGNALGASTDSDDMEDTLPPGVAPGGGQVYGRE